MMKKTLKMIYHNFPDAQGAVVEADADAALHKPPLRPLHHSQPREEARQNQFEPRPGTAQMQRSARGNQDLQTGISQQVERGITILLFLELVLLNKD